MFAAGLDSGPLPLMAKSQAASVGERFYPVKIEKRPSTDVADSSGAPTEEGQWTTLSRVEYMQRMDLNGQERFAAAQESAPYDTAWQMVYRSDMDPDRLDVAKLRRIVWQGRTYDITFASVIGNKRAILIQTLARQG